MKYDYVIIGGGVIGCATAYELAQSGAKILVVDKGEVGFGCSYGNAGWITPCFSMPLPQPGLFWKSFKWLFDPESPLYIKPTPDLLLVRWMTNFMLSMNHTKMKQSVRALTELSVASLAAYKELDKKFQGAIEFSQEGLLMVCQTEDGLEAAKLEMELVGGHGVRGQALTESDVRKLEPAVVGPIKGGVYFPDEAHAEPLKVVRTLQKACEALGVEFRSQEEVFDFEIENGRLKKALTTKGEILGENFVLCAGSWSESLSRRLQLNVPVLGGKGYALITKKLEKNPKIPLMLLEKKIAVTPRQNSLRLAGTLELVKLDFAITPRRVNAIIKGSRQFLELPEKLEISEVWRGLRPCTPDGVPVIGYSSRFSNFFIHTGHQMLGLQSAMGSGKLAAELCLKKAPSFDPAPFKPERF